MYLCTHGRRPVVYSLTLSFLLVNPFLERKVHHLVTKIIFDRSGSLRLTSCIFLCSRRILGRKRYSSISLSGISTKRFYSNSKNFKFFTLLLENNSASFHVIIERTFLLFVH